MRKRSTEQGLTHELSGLACFETSSPSRHLGYNTLTFKASICASASHAPLPESPSAFEAPWVAALFGSASPAARGTRDANRPASEKCCKGRSRSSQVNAQCRLLLALCVSYAPCTMPTRPQRHPHLLHVGCQDTFDHVLSQRILQLWFEAMCRQAGTWFQLQG